MPPTTSISPKIQITGRVHREIFRFPDGSGAVVVLDTKNIVVGPCDPGSLIPGVSYRFYGMWRHHPKYGQQFRFESYEMDRDLDRKSVVSYLCGLLKGKKFGDVRANKIYSLWGKNSLQVVKDSPDTISRTIKVPREVAVEWAEILERNSDSEQLRAELTGLLTGYGFRSTIIGDCIKTWGAKAATIVRNDPFKLIVARIPSAGFLRVDRMYLERGGNPNRLKRSLFAALHYMLNDVGEHTWVSARDFSVGIRNKATSNVPPGKVLELGVRSGKLVTYQDEEGKLWISTTERSTQETESVWHLKRIIGKNGKDWVIPRSDLKLEMVRGKTPTDKQKSAIKFISENKVSVLTGGPGTGKTFCIGAFIRELRRFYDDEQICISAPTGKASDRISEVLRDDYDIPLVARTQHSKLQAYRSPVDGSRWVFSRGESCKLEEDIYIFDETSMQGIPIFSATLKAIPDHAHVVFVGDPYQLPPVDHGLPLIEMIDSGIPHFHLTEVHRYAGRVATVCQGIANGGDWEPSAVVSLEAEYPENFKHMECRVGPASYDALRKVMERLREQGYDLIEDVQVLVATNDTGDIPRANVNKFLRPIVRGVPSSEEDRYKFAVGDKVISTRNVYYKYREDESQDWEEEQDALFANGAIGTVTAIDAGKMVVGVRGGSFLVNRDNWIDFELGYAITFHKSQGSQWKVVICMIDDSFPARMVCNRNLWYTGISRMSKLLVTIGPLKELRNQCAKTSTLMRKTFFGKQLKKLLSEAGT